MYFFKKRFSLCIIPAVCYNPKDTFLEFYMRSHSKLQFVIPNWRYVRSESYFNFMAEKGLYRFSLFITPNVCDILLAIFYVYEFQLIYPFTVNPRKLKSVTHSIRMLFILRRGISFSLCPLTVIEYHDFNFLYNERQFVYGKPIGDLVRSEVAIELNISIALIGELFSLSFLLLSSLSLSLSLLLLLLLLLLVYIIWP